MVSVTITTVTKEAGPRRPSTSRNEGWREAHPSSGCSFLEFSCQAVEYGPCLGSEHLGVIFGKKSPRLMRPLVSKTAAEIAREYDSCAHRRCWTAAASCPYYSCRRRAKAVGLVLPSVYLFTYSLLCDSLVHTYLHIRILGAG